MVFQAPLSCLRSTVPRYDSPLRIAAFSQAQAEDGQCFPFLLNGNDTIVCSCVWQTLSPPTPQPPEMPASELLAWGRSVEQDTCLPAALPVRDWGSALSFFPGFFEGSFVSSPPSVGGKSENDSEVATWKFNSL